MRLKLQVFWLLAILILLCSPTSTFADSFRCGSYLAREGMSMSEMEEKCGKPDVVKTTEEPIRVRRGNGTTFINGVVTTHNWYYERGPSRFVALVVIRESVVEEIKLLEARLIESLGLE